MHWWTIIFNFWKSFKERQEVSALRRSRAARFCTRRTCCKSSDKQLPQTEQQYSMVGLQLAIELYKSNVWFGDRCGLALLINSSLELNFFMHLKTWSDHVREESKYTPSTFSQWDCSTVLPLILTFRYSSVPSSLHCEPRIVWITILFEVAQKDNAFAPLWRLMLSSVTDDEEWYHQHTNEWRLMTCQRECHLHKVGKAKGPDKILVALCWAMVKRQTVMILWRLSVFSPWGMMKTTVIHCPHATP